MTLNFCRILVCALVSLAVGGVALLVSPQGAAHASADTMRATAVLAPAAVASDDEGGGNEALKIALAAAGLAGTLGGATIGYRGGKSIERSRAVGERNSTERRDLDEFVKTCGAISEALDPFARPKPPLSALRTLKKSLHGFTTRSYLIRDKGIRKCGDKLFEAAVDVLALAADTAPQRSATEGIEAYDELRQEADDFLRELDTPKPGIVKRLRGDTHQPRSRLDDRRS